MSRSTFEQLRIPVALALIAVAAFVVWPRGAAEPTATAPSPTVIVGQPGGAALPATLEPSPAAPIPTLTPASTAQPTGTPAPTEATDDAGFTADVLVCRSISGSNCNEELGTVSSSISSFTALVRFTDANGGDTINVVVSGPNGTTSGGEYVLQGGGDGHYFSTFQAGALPDGDYTVTATRNGDEVATTSFRRAG
ncbi:MAG: hypothetical protein M3153_08525 [Chloroflexota bacterium]|nr:hypothetical protein [Chloroflexota bacterium]